VTDSKIAAFDLFPIIEITLASTSFSSFFAQAPGQSKRTRHHQSSHPIDPHPLFALKEFRIEHKIEKFG
jgi:hypothetical protein